MSAHTLQQQAGVLHGRQMVLLATIGLHALVIAVLMTMKVMPDKLFDGHIKLDALLPDRPVEPPPPQLPVSNPLRSSVPYVPEIPVPVPTLPEDSVPTPTQIQLDAGPSAVASTEVVGTGAGPQIASTALQYRAVRSADDYYPSQSLSLQEEGTAIVRVCVSPAGKLDGKPGIEASSGSPRLDAAALTWAREALRFTPATQGGVPVAACKGFRVNFNLH